MGFPLTDRMVSLLRNEIRRGGSGEWVFTFKAKATRRGFVAKQRYPITEEGFKSTKQGTVKAAQLKDWRLIHDLRHTAATETLRSSQNLAAVQQMLGHSDIAQTSRYAHVLASDTRRAMETRR